MDVLDPAVTPRRISILAGRLPPGYRRGGEQWSTEAELLAGVVDVLNQLTWVVLQAAGAKNARKPEPLERPKPRGRHARPEPRGSGDEAPVKYDSWGAAMRAMAGMPGVERG